MPHRGYFAYHHDNPPAPFNPEFDPKAKDRYERVTKSMESDDYYASHSRDECKAEWGRRYADLFAKDRAAEAEAQDEPAGPRP